MPKVVGLGEPAEGYPFVWSVHEWLPGEDANGTLADLDRAAVDLASFVRALRAVVTAGAYERPPGGRGGPLSDSDKTVRRCVAELGDRVDGPAVLRSWHQSLARRAVGRSGGLGARRPVARQPARRGGPADGGHRLGMPERGRPVLRPAARVECLRGESRDRFRAELAVDDASWLRGRGWALAQAIMALPYYWDTNPGMVQQASHALAEVLGDSGI